MEAHRSYKACLPAPHAGWKSTVVALVRVSCCTDLKIMVREMRHWAVQENLVPGWRHSNVYLPGRHRNHPGILWGTLVDGLGCSCVHMHLHQRLCLVSCCAPCSLSISPTTPKHPEVSLLLQRGLRVRFQIKAADSCGTFMVAVACLAYACMSFCL